MAKVINKKNDNKITRDMIVEIGERILNNLEVQNIWISINFNDGSEIKYSKNKSELRKIK